MRRFLLQLTAAFLLAGVMPGQGQEFERPEPKAGFSYSDDFCTNRGIRVELNETSCLVIGDRTVLATCEVSLNNPIWRVTDETCEPEAEVLKAAEN